MSPGGAIIKPNIRDWFPPELLDPSGEAPILKLLRMCVTIDDKKSEIFEIENSEVLMENLLKQREENERDLINT